MKVDNITIDDLIGNVDLTKFYRYIGSLTTPYCHEAVVWTLFHEPIKVHKDLVSALSRTSEVKVILSQQRGQNGLFYMNLQSFKVGDIVLNCIFCIYVSFHAGLSHSKQLNH